MFNQFLKNDLVYRDTTFVNWCPKDQTVLANEQVVDGCCERCGSQVEQKNQKQWMIRITKYADRLIDDLDALDWPNQIKASQKAWIGRSEGSEITFELSTGDKMPVFTTRADTLFGVTYVVLAPEHELVQSMKDKIENWDDVESYIKDTQKKSELDRQQSKEKTGVELKGIKATNPANGEQVPVWISDYVLAGYGTGAVMAVPAHDERDFEFAQKFGLEIKNVVEPITVSTHGDSAIIPGEPFIHRDNVAIVLKNPNTGKYLCTNWRDHHMHGVVTGGIDEGEDIIECAIREVKEETGYRNVKFSHNPNFAVQAKFFHRLKKLNRWARYQIICLELENEERGEIEEHEDVHELVWMEPKEMEGYATVAEAVYAAKIAANPEYVFTEHGVLINSGEFDGMLTEEARTKITEKVGGELKKTYRLRDWGISRQRYWGCPIPIVYDPEGKAHPVPDEHLPWTLPEDVDHTPDGTAPLARSEDLKKRTIEIFGEGWTPEVETMDTFVDSTWYFYRYLDNKNNKEFSAKEMMDSWMPIDLYMGGAEHTTMHVLYSRFWTKALFDLGLVKDEEAFKIRLNRGLILGPDGNKMSKSKGNVINPDEIVERLGADTVRLYLCFMGPYGVTVNYPWDPNGVVGVRRFLERVWRVKDIVGVGNQEDETLLHQTIEGVTKDIENFKFNTAISKMMILVNAWEKSKTVSKEGYKDLLKLLAPFAPHMTEEIWRSELDEKESIHTSSWPNFDPEKIKIDAVELVIQINGKVRAKISGSIGMSEEEVMDIVRSDESINKWLTGDPKKVIHIKDKLLNIVV